MPQWKEKSYWKEEVKKLWFYVQKMSGHSELVKIKKTT